MAFRVDQEAAAVQLASTVVHRADALLGDSPEKEWLVPLARRVMRDSSLHDDLWKSLMLVAWAAEHLLDYLIENQMESHEAITMMQCVEDLHRAEIAMNAVGGYDPMAERLAAAMRTPWAAVEPAVKVSAA